MMELSKISLADGAKVRLDERGLTPAFFCRSNPVRVDARLVAELVRVSEERGRLPLRLCLHDSPENSLHDMVVLVRLGAYAPPHKHLEKSESYHVIAGRAAILVFDDAGAVVDRCVLDPGGIFLYRVGARMFHSLVPLTDYVVYHESRPGPFQPQGDSVFPDWAPEKSRREEGIAFYAGLMKGWSA